MKYKNECRQSSFITELFFDINKAMKGVIISEESYNAGNCGQIKHF